MLNHRLISRRQALRWGLGIASAGGAIASCGHSLSSSPVSPATSVTEPDQLAAAGEQGLHQRAAARGLFYGTAANYNQLSSDRRYQQAVLEECGVLVEENSLKWDGRSPAPNQYNFEEADWMVDFALQHGLKFRGHTLIWEQAIPGWFESTVTSRNAERVMTQYIRQVMGHYAGRIASWDVVNEATNPYSRTERLSRTPWQKVLGDDYIELAFRTAAAADPRALLVYNEGWLEYLKPEHQNKRDNVLSLLREWKSKDVPIQALGVQAHLFAGEERIDYGVIRTFLRDVASLGLKIIITELDVSDVGLPADIRTRDRLVADTYTKYLETALDERAVIGVVTWGLSDRYTWLTRFEPRDDGRPVRVLPLDEEFNRKPAWGAIARAFDQAPQRN